MELSYPIVVIVTNEKCSHCVNMRGKNGWPSDENIKKFSSLIEDESKEKWGWNEIFFKTLLKGGQKDGRQYCKVYELFYDTLETNKKIIEFTIFSLNKDDKLIIKKYCLDKDTKKTILFRSDNLSFIQKKYIDVPFLSLINDNFPINQLSKYIYLFPTFIYIHSFIWERALKNRISGSLYARVQGLKTVRHPLFRSEYRVLKEKNINRIEMEKNPIDVVKKLRSSNLEPLFYPADHEDED